MLEMGWDPIDLQNCRILLLEEILEIIEFTPLIHYMDNV